MNILFLTMNVFTDIDMHNIYSDLMKVYINHGYRPYIVTPRERKSGEKTELINYDNYSLLKVEIGNTSGVSFIEKGISTVTMSNQYYNMVKKYLGNLQFSLILYSTPPITLAEPVKKLKKHFNCRTYLMLKDIFPQNAVDLGLFSQNGFIYKFFRYQERKLYMISDAIGCMSPANMEYLIDHNKYLMRTNIEVCPNAIIPRKAFYLNLTEIRKKYGIPEDVICYIYGGNLGKPQGVSFIIECLQKMEENENNYFVICGSGSEYSLFECYFAKKHPKNVLLLNGLCKKDYDELLSCCDIGMLFLDYRFTIPNFPSRMLSYMEQSIPILACTDKNTDVGRIITEGRFGWWCASDNVEDFQKLCLNIYKDRDNIKKMGKRARQYLEENYSSEHCFKIIEAHRERKF